MARQQIGWVSPSGEYFSGTPEERRAQQRTPPADYISPYLTGEERRIAERKRTKETIRRQQEESRLEGLLSRKAKGLGAGYPGQPGYVAPERVSIEQKWANLAELRRWRRMKTLYGGVGGYVAPGQYVPSAYSLSFMRGGQPSPTPTMGTFTTPTTPPPTPIAPTPQPTPTPSISVTPATPQQIMPTYKPASATAYKSTYYQANGYKPYSYGDTWGDKSFGYAYKPSRIQQSYTGI